MQSDISFVKIYIDFYKLISHLYISNLKFSNKYFFNILESKFLYDYKDIEYLDDFKFLLDYEDNDNPILSENKRVNHLTIIRTMMNAGLLDIKLETFITDELLNQKNHYADIYYWMQNKQLDQKTKNIIKNIVSNNTLPLREKVLLDNLILEPKNTDSVKSESKSENKQVSKDQNITTDTLSIESENIIEEYLYMESIEEVKAFIDNRCKDAISKNKFCQYLFNKYFETNTETASKILDFIKILVKKQILFKSNLSRGLLLLHSNWDDLEDDYNNPNKKMKELLICLKNLGITKNLEELLKTHKIEYTA